MRSIVEIRQHNKLVSRTVRNFPLVEDKRVAAVIKQYRDGTRIEVTPSE